MHFLNTNRKSNGLPNYLRYQDKGSSNSDEICNFYADHFKSNINLSLTDIESSLLSSDENTYID